MGSAQFTRVPLPVTPKPSRKHGPHHHSLSARVPRWDVPDPLYRRLVKGERSVARLSAQEPVGNPPRGFYGGNCRLLRPRSLRGAQTVLHDSVLDLRRQSPSCDTHARGGILTQPASHGLVCASVRVSSTQGSVPDVLLPSRGSRRPSSPAASAGLEPVSYNCPSLLFVYF